VEFKDFIQDRRVIVKRWIQDALLGARKSVAEIAEAMGFRNESSLYKSANPFDENHHLHLHNLPVLIFETQNLKPLDQLEALFDRVAFAIPREVPDLAEVCQEFGRMVREFGDVAREYGKAMEDGRLSRDERAKLRKEVLELMRQAGVFLKAVEAE